MRRHLIALAAALCSQMASAAVTYTYQGVPIGTHSVAPLVVGDSVAGFITFASEPLTGNFGAADFLDYGFSVGSLSLSKGSGADLGAHFVFDPVGQITGWSLGVGRYPAGLVPPASLVEISISSADGDRFVVNTPDGRTVFGAFTQPGTWAPTSPVPEPASALLMIAGLAALAGIRPYANALAKRSGQLSGRTAPSWPLARMHWL